MVLQRIREEEEMKRRTKILKEHPYQPTYNERTGRWYTRFNIDGKIVQRSRKNQDEINDMIVAFYANQETVHAPVETVYTFDKAHDRWLEMQKEYGRVNNSIRRYETDWARFFSDSEFAKMSINEITSRDIELFMISNIQKFNLKRRGADGLYACINGVFYNAVMDKKLDAQNNPCILVDKKKFDKYYNTDEKTIEERTLSPNDLILLINRIDEDIKRRESYIYPYGVRLALLTGMRVGEIAGLRWCHINDRYMKICESEKYDVVEKRYYQSKTKNNKIRNVPITNEIRLFLNCMKELQEKYGVTEDFVLSTAEMKLRGKNLTAYMNHKCEQLEFENHQSIHAIRRTFNSYLRYDGVSATEAGSIIGNTPKVNDQHYTYDIQELARKIEYVSNVEKRMIAPSA